MQIHAIAACEREAQTNLLVDGAAVAHPAHRPVECAFLAAEYIVGLANAIERNADVGGAEFLEFPRGGFIQQRAVRREGQAEPLADRVAHQVEQIRSGEWFASGKQDGRHLERREVVDHSQGFVVSQFAGILLRVAVRVTVHAPQVAGAGNVPHDDRAAFRGGFRGAVAMTISQPIGGLLFTAVELGNIDHDAFSSTLPGYNASSKILCLLIRRGS